MSTIPTIVTENQFEKFIKPSLSTGQRGPKCKIPLRRVFNYILYHLHTGCPWTCVPIRPDVIDPEKPEISYSTIYYYYRKWSQDGSFYAIWQNAIVAISSLLDLSILNIDGTHTIAKKGGEAVKYQGRKKANTTNFLAITDANGYFLAISPITAGNHNDAFQLVARLRKMLQEIKMLGFSLNGAYFNADPAFDTKASRKFCFNNGLVPNVKANSRNRKSTKPGPKRFFEQDIYNQRYVIERSFAWADKFRAISTRSQQKSVFFLGANCLAFAMINLRNLFD